MQAPPDIHSITHVVAIDGPAGAGKSTVARRVARTLGYQFLDTGAMYRAATWRALSHDVDLSNRDRLVQSTTAMRLELYDEPTGYRVVVDGTDVTDAIRTPEVTREIFHLDQIPDVRAVLVDLQRGIGAQRPTVAEGRDMGTVVFPAARCKVFLVASIAARAERRLKDLAAKGIVADLEEVTREIAERDRHTETRQTAPLRRATDAVEVDTTSMTIDGVVETIVGMAKATL